MARLPERVRIGVVGLGWVGCEVARAAMEDPRVRLVGVVDQDPAKAGRDLGEILGEGRIGLSIDSELDTMLSRARPEVTVLATSSEVAAITPLVERCLASGTHVVTSCENLASPELLEPEVARRLDESCRKSGVVVLATGVNPGFAMDRLPVMLSQATRNIRRVRVLRVVDAASRRSQLQAKAGIGLAAKEFSRAVHEGRVGHAGLGASLRLVAKGLGVSLDRTAETMRPLIAETPSLSSVLGPVETGGVRGIYQVARGYRGDSELITLELILALDEPNARDVIDIVGEPPLHFVGELPGDHCTVATVLSSIPLVVNMVPGLRTVLDLPAEQPEEPLEPRESMSAPRASTQIPLTTTARGPVAPAVIGGPVEPAVQPPPAALTAARSRRKKAVAEVARQIFEAKLVPPTPRSAPAPKVRPAPKAKPAARGAKPVPAKAAPLAKAVKPVKAAKPAKTSKPAKASKSAKASKPAKPSKPKRR